jgi:hypothetical protein
LAGEWSSNFSQSKNGFREQRERRVEGPEEEGSFELWKGRGGVGGGIGMIGNGCRHGQQRKGMSMRECESEIGGAIRRDQGDCVRGAWGIDRLWEGGRKIDGDRDVK